MNFRDSKYFSLASRGVVFLVILYLVILQISYFPDNYIDRFVFLGWFSWVKAPFIFYMIQVFQVLVALLVLTQKHHKIYVFLLSLLFIFYTVDLFFSQFSGLTFTGLGYLGYVNLSLVLVAVLVYVLAMKSESFLSLKWYYFILAFIPLCLGVYAIYPLNKAQMELQTPVTDIKPPADDYLFSELEKSGQEIGVKSTLAVVYVSAGCPHCNNLSRRLASSFNYYNATELEVLFVFWHPEEDVGAFRKRNHIEQYPFLIIPQNKLFNLAGNSFPVIHIYENRVFRGIYTMDLFNYSTMHHLFTEGL